jgi:predicted DNA-binding transcriptional regulator YafY
MNHPTTRLLTVLELLQTYPRLSGAELAERLEIDRRTLRRYITMLQDMGIPIEAERGRFGGYRLRPGFRLPPLMFNEEEALALTLGMLTVQQFGLTASAQGVEGVITKLERVLPTALRQQIEAVRQSVSFTWEPSSLPPTSQSVLVLSKAIHETRQVWLRYSSFRKEESQRVLEPYGLVCEAGRWYVVGWCHLREGVRVFRLDRILGATLLKTYFTPPDGFDCAAYVQEALARTPYNWTVEVLLDTTLEEARRKVPPTVALIKESEAGILLRTQAETLEWAASFLVGLDCPFTVLHPPELKATLQTLADRIKEWAEHEVSLIK